MSIFPPKRDWGPKRVNSAIKSATCLINTWYQVINSAGDNSVLFSLFLSGVCCVVHPAAEHLLACEITHHDEVSLKLVQKILRADDND